MIFFGVLALLNLYVASGVIHRWPGANEHAALAWGLAFLLLALQFAGPFGDRVWAETLRKKYALRKLVTVFDWLSYVTFGVVSSMLVYTLVADIISLVWGFVALPADQAAFDRDVLVVMLSFAFATTVLGLWQGWAGPDIRRVDVPLPHLPDAFDGFTIAQISDLHIGPTIGRRYAEKVVRMTNALKPDLVALTGDFADGHVPDLRHDIAPIADLTAPHGKFYVTGNHEYYWGADAWMREFERMGAKALKNEHVLIENKGSRIVLAGVTDYSTRHRGGADATNPAAAIAGAPPDAVKILLAHQPVTFTMAEKAGYDLQLSGHTHSGQYFPFSLMIRFFQVYYKGLNRYKDMWIYVNRGTGYWGPPLRTFVGSEVTLLTLRKG